MPLSWPRPRRTKEKGSHRFAWKNPYTTVEHLQDVQQKRIQLCKELDNYGFNWQVWAVAASGFFTDSYNLFATNVILPALAFIYWPDATDTSRESTINLVTLSATIVGQLVFGYFADRYGRQKLYGIELILVTLATLGLAQSSAGITTGHGSGSMSILGWILFWRTLMGFGIGAEYPISACISAEWASTKTRARMLASVFIMQPIGQCAAYIVGLVVLLILRDNDTLSVDSSYNDAAPVVDQFWRWVTGLGAVPAVVALVFRLTIPESGRWRIDVQGRANQAIIDTRAHYGVDDIVFDEGDDLEIRSISTSTTASNGTQVSQVGPISLEYLHRFLIKEGNWRALAGTSLCWALFDFAYYGLQINNPRFLAKLWASRQPEQPVNSMPAWLPNPALWNVTTDKPTTTVYQVLIDNSTHALISVSIGSILGSLLLICVIDYIPRRRLLVLSFVALALLTAGTGISYLRTFQSSLNGVTLALFIACQLLFNFGPNTLTFVIPAEIFPTPIRCTCAGIAAASGKLASVIVQAILPRIQFNGMLITSPRSNGMGKVLIIFSAALALGSLCAWFWIPELQISGHSSRFKSKRPSKTLEELALGRAAMAQGPPDRQIHEART